MNWAAKKKKIEKLKVKLRRWGLDPKTYQYLDVLFRHALMLSPATQYLFDDGMVDKKLADENLGFDERMAKIEAYIKKWNANRPIQEPIEYAFGQIGNDQFKQDEVWIEQYNLALKRLNQIQLQKNAFLTKEEVAKWKANLKQRLIYWLVKQNQSPLGRYLDFQENGTAFLREGNHDYFRNYINYCHGVYDEVMELTAQHMRHKKSKIYCLISAKIQHEHAWIKGIKIFNPHYIRGRIQNSESNRIDGVYEPTKLGLINDEFIQAIVEENQEWLQSIQSEIA